MEKVIEIRGPLSEQDEEEMMKVVAAMGKKSVVVEVDGKRRVIRAVQTDAEGRELLED